MVVTTVQHVTQAASEGLNAKFSDLCDADDLSNVSVTRTRSSNHSAKSRLASSKATLRQLRDQERRLSVSSTDNDAFLMPLKRESKLFGIRSRFCIAKFTGSPSSGLQSYCSSQRKKSHGASKKLLKFCTGSKGNSYTPLLVY